MTTKLSERKLKTLVQESVREALSAEIFKLRALVLPLVSPGEQKEIERRYGKPSRRAHRTYKMTV